MDNLVIESLKFMVLGMSIVYLLLALIVFLVGLQHKIIEKYFPDKPKIPLAVSSNNQKVNNHINNEDEEVIAAITAAVTRYNKK